MASANVKVIAYIRVSTEDQNLGPEAQRAAMARWCAANDAVIVAEFEDRLSGGKGFDEARMELDLTQRPELLRAVDAVEELGATVLLVAKRDRLARDTVVSALVERLVTRKGGKIVAADGVGNGDGPEAMLMRHIVNAFAEYERAIIRARTKGALAVKKARGERVGQIPYGKRLEGAVLIADEVEVEVIGRMRELRVNGVTLRGIAEALNAEGVPARSQPGKTEAGRWHHPNVLRILESA